MLTQTTLSLCPLCSPGDLYGAIGSPVRLTRTVVVGKQKDLVQRILYVLTYFLRCSELQENQLTWSGNHGEDEQVLNGSSITTALERGEVEESEYVVVTVRSEPALLPPILTPTAAEGLAGAQAGTDIKGPCPKVDGEGSLGPGQSPADSGAWRSQGMSCGDEESQKEDPRGGSSRLPSCAGLGPGLKMGEEVRAELPKMLPDRSGARPCPDAHSRERSPWEKVTFHIGSSASPESDFESRTKTMEERLQAWCVEPSARPGSAADDSALEAQDQQASRCSCAPPGVLPAAFAGSSGGSVEVRSVRTEVVADAAGLPSAPAGWCASVGSARARGRTWGTRGKNTEGPVPDGDASSQASFRVEGDIPRNESLDSALGASDDEACASASLDLGPGNREGDLDGPERSLEVELPLPR